MTLPLNRRRAGHTRLPIRVPAETEALHGGPACGRGEAQDLSPGGAQVHLEQALPSGASVRVTFRLRQRAPLMLLGTVAWVRPHPDSPGWALGIRFDAELPGETVAEIADAEFPPWTPPRRDANPPVVQ